MYAATTIVTVGSTSPFRTRRWPDPRDGRYERRIEDVRPRERGQGKPEEEPEDEHAASLDTLVRKLVGVRVQSELTPANARNSSHVRILIVDTCYPAFLASHYQRATGARRAARTTSSGGR